MIYSSDTKPETNSVNQALQRNQRRGRIHATKWSCPRQVWPIKNMGLNARPTPQLPLPLYIAGVQAAQGVRTARRHHRERSAYLSA